MLIIAGETGKDPNDLDSEIGQRLNMFAAIDQAGHSPVWLATLDGSTVPRRLSTIDAARTVFGAHGDVCFFGAEDQGRFVYHGKEDGSGLEKASMWNNRCGETPMRCRLCSGDLRPWLEMPIDAKKNEPTPFKSLARCASCDVGMLTPQPTADEIGELYRLPSYYTHGESHIRHVEPRFWDKVLTKLSWIVDYPTPFDPNETARLLPPHGSICDLGCGHGSMLRSLQKMGYDVIGIDPDPFARKLAAEAGLRVLAGMAEALPAELSGRQFDLVIMTHTLEHCLDPVEAIRNAYLLTKNGGYFYCEVPNCGCLHFETLTVCSESFDSPRHLWFFTAAGLRRAIEGQGYTFEDWRFDGFTRHHSVSWRAWEITIFDRLAKRGELNAGKRHTFARSLAILAKSAFAPAHKKYDCVGVIARKREVSITPRS